MSIWIKIIYRFFRNKSKILRLNARSSKKIIKKHLRSSCRTVRNCIVQRSAYCHIVIFFRFPIWERSERVVQFTGDKSKTNWKQEVSRVIEFSTSNRTEGTKRQSQSWGNALDKLTYPTILHNFPFRRNFIFSRLHIKG